MVKSRFIRLVHSRFSIDCRWAITRLQSSSAPFSVDFNLLQNHSKWQSMLKQQSSLSTLCETKQRSEGVAPSKASDSAPTVLTTPASPSVKSTCGNDHNAATTTTKNDDDDDDDESFMEEMFVEPYHTFEHSQKEWGGPTRGGKFAEPTRFGDWERKGRCTDF